MIFFSDYVKKMKMLNMSELDTVSEHGWVFLNKDECSQFLRKINQINKYKCFSSLKTN